MNYNHILACFNRGRRLLDCIIETASIEDDSLVLELKYRADPRTYRWKIDLLGVEFVDDEIDEFAIETAVDFEEAYARAPRIVGDGVLVLSSQDWWTWDPDSEDVTITRAELRSFGDSFVRRLTGADSLDSLDGPLPLLGLVRSIDVPDSATELGCLGVYELESPSGGVKVSEISRFNRKRGRALIDAVRSCVLFAGSSGYETVVCELGEVDLSRLGFKRRSDYIAADTSLSVRADSSGDQ